MAGWSGVAVGAVAVPAAGRVARPALGAVAVAAAVIVVKPSEQFGGQRGQGGLVDAAGDDGGDGRVAGVALGGAAGQPARLPLSRRPCRLGGVRGGPVSFGAGGAGQVAELL